MKATGMIGKSRHRALLFERSFFDRDFDEDIFRLRTRLACAFDIDVTNCFETKKEAKKDEKHPIQSCYSNHDDTAQRFNARLSMSRNCISHTCNTQTFYPHDATIELHKLVCILYMVYVYVYMVYVYMVCVYIMLRSLREISINEVLHCNNEVDFYMQRSKGEGEIGDRNNFFLCNESPWEVIWPFERWIFHDKDTNSSLF